MRILKTIIYLAILGVTLALGWTRFVLAGTILLSGACYFPDPPFWPLWLALALLTLFYMVWFVVGAVRRSRIKLYHHALVIGLFGVVLIGRMVGPLADPLGTQKWLELDDAPPHWLMARAAARLNQELSRSAKLPEGSEDLAGLLTEQGRSHPTGYLGHGLALPLVVVRLAGRSGPQLQVRPGDRPGTLYLALAPDEKLYWITAVGLSEYPIGDARIMADPDGAHLVLSGKLIGGGSR